MSWFDDNAQHYTTQGQPQQGGIVGSDPNYSGPMTATGVSQSDPYQGYNWSQVPDFSHFTPTQIGDLGYRPGSLSAQQLDMPTDFKQPTAEDMVVDPSYQFRLKQGQQGLTNSALARGIGRTGGFVKGLSDYNQQAASQEYGNIYNRALQTNQTNFGNRLQTVGANNAANAQAFGLTNQYGLAGAQLDLQRQLANQQNQFQGWNANNQYGLQLGQYGQNAQQQAWNQNFQNNQNTWLQNYALSQLGQPPQ